LPFQILQLARDNNKAVKVVGEGHSPSDIGCTDGYMISMEKFNKLIDVS
jgi:FAD/FMN-containing dehydrogenase